LMLFEIFRDVVEEPVRVQDAAFPIAKKE